jgi:hypothetical protein
VEPARRKRGGAGEAGAALSAPEMRRSRPVGAVKDAGSLPCQSLRLFAAVPDSALR